MNDHELRRRLAELRVPPADPEATERALDRALFTLDHAGAQPGESTWTWRDWLWPSPLVWGAIAALWIVIIGQAAQGPADDSSRSPVAAQTGSEPTAPPYPLFARSEYRALLRELQQHANAR